MNWRYPRRATAYLLVLVAVLVTVSIGVTGSLVHRSRQERLTRVWEIERASQIAQAGIELSVAYIQSDQAWRANRGLGAWMDEQPLLGGTVTVIASDPDGVASDDLEDDVTLVSEGRFGAARQVVSASFTPVPIGMDSLSFAISAGGNVGFEKVIAANAGITSNRSMAASGATVQADVYAVSTIMGTTFYGQRFPSSAARQLPSASVFDWYVSNGTAISRASLPGGDLRKIVLSPTHNPYGATNPLGIYVIDCGNNRIRVQDCRIEGTLVLLNTKSDSEVSNEVSMRPADPTLPALLVKGSITIKTENRPLSESSERINFNPPTAPYNGISDDDQLDEYPTRIEGLIYVSGQLTFDRHVVMLGQAIVGGPVVFKADSHTITWSDTYVNDPPPGFITRYNIRLRDGSLARVIDE